MSESPTQIVRSVSAACFAALVLFPCVFVIGLYLFLFGCLALGLTLRGFPSKLPSSLGGTFPIVVLILDLIAAAFFSHRFYRMVVSFRRLSETPECETCGYNLTGNVSGRCPECGTEIVPHDFAGNLNG